MSDDKLKKAPARIWLQAWGDASPSEIDESDKFDGSGGAVTWCDEQIFDMDVPYIRADLVDVPGRCGECFYYRDFGMCGKWDMGVPVDKSGFCHEFKPKEKQDD